MYICILFVLDILTMNDTREYIIDRAYGLFLNKSYEAVSISELSNAIGLTKGALYHHFVNKEELFMAVIDKYLVIDGFNINTECTTLKQYMELTINKSQDIIYHMLSSPNSYIPLNLLSLSIDAFRHYPRYAVKKEELIKSEVSKVKKVLDLAIEKGEIRSDISTSSLAEMIFTLNTGIARNLIHNNMNPETAIEVMKEQFSEFYKLLRP